jgi:hypothetical protein
MDEKGIMIPVDPVKEKDLYDRYCSQTLGIMRHPAA